MPYAKGGEAFEDHLFGPDYDDNGKIRQSSLWKGCRGH